MKTTATIASLCTLCAFACMPLTAMGQGTDDPLAAFGSEWVPMDPARLAKMRGGLVMPSGLSLSFGIERLVYVNGQLTASATLQIPDVRRISPEQADALAAINQGTVVQLGEGNRVDSGAAGNALVIQNALDGQDINVLTTLNVGVGTLGMLQELNSYDALRSALITSPGTP